MGCCGARCTLMSICIFQMVFITERTVFDALGGMYGLLAADITEIIMVFVGVVGIYTNKPKYLVPYGTWQFLWIGWNAYVMCFYLKTGWLGRVGMWEYPLTLTLDSSDYFDKALLTCNSTLVDDLRLRQEKESSATLLLQNIGYNDVNRAPERDMIKLFYTIDPDCLIRPIWIKMAQCALQVFFALFTILYVCYVVYSFVDEDDSFDFIGGFDHFNPGYPETKMGPHGGLGHGGLGPPPNHPHGPNMIPMNQMHSSAMINELRGRQFLNNNPGESSPRDYGDSLA